MYSNTNVQNSKMSDLTYQVAKLISWYSGVNNVEVKIRCYASCKIDTTINKDPTDVVHRIREKFNLIRFKNSI